MNSAGSVGARDALDYIGAMLGEIQDMAVSHRLPVLAHLIEMARIEASDQAAALKLESESAKDGHRSTRMSF